MYQHSRTARRPQAPTALFILHEKFLERDSHIETFCPLKYEIHSYSALLLIIKSCTDARVRGEPETRV